MTLVTLRQPIRIQSGGEAQTDVSVFKAESRTQGRGDSTFRIYEVYLPAVLESLRWQTFSAVVTVNEAIIAATQEL